MTVWKVAEGAWKDRARGIWSVEDAAAATNAEEERSGNDSLRDPLARVGAPAI